MNSPLNNQQKQDLHGRDQRAQALENLTSINTQVRSSSLSTLANSRGFSLVEIMIVLAIIGIIVSIGGNSLLGGLDKARVREATSTIAKFSDALQIYESECGTFPTTEEGLQALIEEVSSCGSDWGGPYLKKIGKDPWKQEYQYESDGSSFTITSFGKDKRPGGDGLGKDISNRDDEDEEDG